MDERTFERYLQTLTSIIKKYAHKYQGNPAIEGKIQHIRNCSDIAKELKPNDKLLQTAVLYHDIGRFSQYDQIQSFDDQILNHGVVGEGVFDALLQDGVLPKQQESDYIKAAIRWHVDKKEALNRVDSPTYVVIEFVTTVDQLENGCVGIKRYYEREVEEDAKHYKVNTPNIDMKSVRAQYFAEYKRNENLKKTCITYAEYLLYAASLTLKACKSEPEVTRKMMKENEMYSWYKEMFIRYIEKKYAETAYSVLLEKLGLGK